MYSGCFRGYSRRKKVICQAQEYIQISRVSRGGISIKEIGELSYSQYKIIRKAAEIEEIRERLMLITDMNAAFSGNKTHMTSLEKRFQETQKNIVAMEALENTVPDSDWKTRLARFKR